MPGEIEQWSEVHSGVEYQCFRTARGELFHFRKSELKRGKPCAPFNTIEEFTRPVRMVTLQCAADLAGVGWKTMKDQITFKKIPSTKKIWKHGRQYRHGLLIDVFDLQEWMARRAIEHYSGHRIEWDYSALGLLGRGGSNERKGS